MGKGILLGALAGVACGWLVIAFNMFSGVAEFENGFISNALAFSTGGGLFGVIVGGLMTLLEGRLPFSGTLSKTVSISVGIWLILRLGGTLLSMNDPQRFHPDFAQTLQGLLFAVALGLILGVLWNRKPEGSV